MNSSLEKHVAELSNLPGHILGLDGWLLRNLPKESRVGFLKEHLKALTIAFHPDRVLDEKEKKRREHYLQTVSNAVSLLSRDPHLYTLATEDVPSTRNPLVRLKQELQNYQKDIEKLQEQIVIEQRERELLGRQIQSLYGEMSTLEEYATNIGKGFRDQTQFRVLKDYVQWALTHSHCIPLNIAQIILLEGKKMRIQRTINDGERARTLREVFLFDEAHKEHASFQKQQEVFGDQIRQNLIYSEQRSFFFENNQAKSHGEDIFLVGSMPAPAINAYTVFHELPINYIKPRLDSSFETSRLYRKILFYGQKDSPEHRKYVKNIRPFVLPFVSPATPTLIKRTHGNQVHYEFLFTENITSHPSGTELDFWFSVPSL